MASPGAQGRVLDLAAARTPDIAETAPEAKPEASQEPIFWLDGWQGIADHFERLIGIRRTVRTLQRWAARTDDPMPIRSLRYGRTVADPEALSAWWKRETSRDVATRRDMSQSKHIEKD